jgi:hypothetical protein
VPAGRLLHNYGHGGAGVSLSWGCADDIVAALGSLPSTGLSGYRTSKPFGDSGLRLPEPLG